MAAWLSGSALVSINEVTLRRALLVLLGWITVGGRVNVTNHSGQLSLLPSAGQKISTGQSAMTLWCDDALRLGSKGMYGSFHLWINMWVTGKAV